MILSMTGYGQVDLEVDGVAFGLEARTLNHRHLDLNVRLPRGCATFEPEIRAAIQARLSRGKVDLAMRSVSSRSSADTVSLDWDALGRYLEAGAELERQGHVARGWDARALLGLPGVARLVERELPPEALREATLEALATALDSVEAMRAAEGANLERELRGRLEQIDALGAQVEARAGDVQTVVRDRLRKRAEQLRDETGLLDDARLHQEVIFAADRMDVTEEVVRLRTHTEHFRTLMNDAGPGCAVGRRLDFLLQEVGREVNTIGSKGGDAPIAHLVVELKAEVERVREQVQNIE